MKSALDVVDVKKKEIQDRNLGVDVRLEYIEINDSRTFDILDSGSSRRSHPDPMILSGALWVGKTRLIDNILLGDTSEIFALTLEVTFVQYIHNITKTRS